MLPERDIRESIANFNGWELLRGQHIFVTGGTGFFGQWILSVLSAADKQLGLDLKVTALSRNPEGFLLKFPQLSHFRYITGDIKRFDFPEDPCSMVIHAANTSDVDYLETFDNLVTGTRRVLDYAQLSRAKRFLYVSSGAVYGRQPPTLSHIDEDYCGGPNVLCPQSAYGEGKRASELLCSLYSKRFGIDIVTARCFAFLGPGLPLDANFAAGNFILDSLHGGPITIRGDGTPVRSYLYPTDLVTWLLTLLVCGASGETYNVGSDGCISINGLAGKISCGFAKQPEITTMMRWDGAVPERYVPNIDKAKALGLSVRIGLEEAIRRTIDFYEEE